MKENDLFIVPFPLLSQILPTFPWKPRILKKLDEILFKCIINNIAHNDILLQSNLQKPELIFLFMKLKH